MSMYRQLWLAILSSMLLALIGSLLASTLSARTYLAEQLSMKNTDNAAALALSLSQQNPDAVIVELAVAALYDSGHYELIRVTDPRGQVIVERKADTVEQDAPGWFVRLLPIEASPGHAQISNGWKQFGDIELISHSRFAYQSLWNSVLQMIIALTLSGVIAGYMGHLILSRLRRPLREVIHQARAITDRRFITIDEPKVPELKHLARAMNATVARLKTMFEEEANRLESVRREANYDPLTGLSNRSFFMGRLQAQLSSEEGDSGALLLIRVAQLTDINKRLGRAATDDMLRRYGVIISSIVKKIDGAHTARLNGADFAVVLPPQSANGQANLLLHALQSEGAAFVESGPAVLLALAPFEHGEEMGSLLARTDAALAAAEAEGGTSVQISAPKSDTREPQSAGEWEKTLVSALEHGWVRLIDFPVADFSSRLVHRECPLRLRFEEDGEWQPAGRFLPVAERLKLTARLDLAAIGLGLAKLQADASLPGLAINLSASSLQHEEFFTSLKTLLKQHKREAPKLWLEVAESGAFREWDHFRALSALLKPFSCKLGIEHFGRHFSQIGLLHDLGLDYLKVDASFIRDLNQNPGNQAFLQGLRSISRNIGLLVYAEGVASAEELAALAEIGFDGATGPAVKLAE